MPKATPSASASGARGSVASTGRPRPREGARPAASPYRDRMAAAALFLAAVLLRLPHLGWGLPLIEEEALPMKKAFEMWGWSSGRLSLDPHTAGWPSLSFYLHLALQKLHYLVGHATGQFANRFDYYVQYLVDCSQLVLISRAVSVAMAAGVVVIGFRVARRLAGWWPGLLAGALLAVAPLLVEHGQQVTPDILLVFCSALAVERMLDVLERGHSRDYVWTAVWIGLGAAAKYTPVLLAPVLYAAHLMRLRRERRPLRGWGLDDKRLGYAALAAALVFCACNPYLFAGMQVLKRDFGYQVLHMTQAHFGQELQSASGHWYYLSHVLAPGVGIPALCIGMMGLVGTGLRRCGGWGLLGLSALAYFAALGSFSTRFDRYMLPVLLPLAAGCAAFWTLVRPWLPARRGLLRAAALGLALVVLLPALALTVRYHHTQGLPSTQAQARQYITRQLPPDRNFFAAELYTVQLPSTEVRDELKASPVYQRLDQRQRDRLLAMPAYEYTFIPFYSTRVEMSAFYYDLRLYEVYDFLITSGAVRGRYEANPGRYPQQVQFYRDLEAYAHLERAFEAGDHARGPDIRIYRWTREGKQRLLADRGALQPGWYAATTERSDAARHTAFLESIAGHAYLRERFDLAQLFYQTLLDLSPPAERSLWLFRCAYAHMRQDDLEVARRQFEEYLRTSPDDTAALADLGLLYERTGDQARARSLYQQVIALTKDAERREWARRQLQALAAGAGNDLTPRPGTGP